MDKHRKKPQAKAKEQKIVTTVALPQKTRDLIDILCGELFVKPNVVISQAVEHFYNSHNAIEEKSTFPKNKIIVPLETYLTLKRTNPITVSQRIKEGKLEQYKTGRSVYILLNPDSEEGILVAAAQLKTLSDEIRRDVRDFKEHEEMEIDRLKKEIEELKAQIYKKH